MAEENYAVEIKNLTKLYGKNKALSNISFNVKRGEIMGFLGPNGAGKSTTMNIICGCISANSGSALVCGCDVLETPKIVKSKIGYLPEQPPLYYDMTVKEYLEFVYELKKVKLNKKKHLQEVMERVKISHMAGRIIRNLSKGYKQRVGLAQALIGDPEVLILDEPTVGLDPKQIIEIRNVIKELGKKRTVILSTHILQEVEAVCDSVTIIANGKIVAQNTIDELTAQTGKEDKYVITVLGDTQTAKSVISMLPEIEKSRVLRSNENRTEFVIEQKSGCDIRVTLTRALCEQGLSIGQLRAATPTLEEVFIKLTTNTADNAEDCGTGSFMDNVINKIKSSVKENERSDKNAGDIKKRI